MPDEPRKPLAKLHSSVPENVREFVRCRSDSLDIAPQALDIPGLPGVTLSFDDGDNGSVTIRLDAPGDFLDADIPVSIEDGHLVADTSSLSMGRGHVDQWIKDFNADLDAPLRNNCRVSPFETENCTPPRVRSFRRRRHRVQQFKNRRWCRQHHRPMWSIPSQSRSSRRHQWPFPRLPRT